MIVRETGSIAGVFGLCDSGNPDVGYIWALTSEEVFDKKFRLHRVSKKFIDESQSKYKILTNLVWEGNESHIKWLTALGFIFINEKTINNNNFYEFVRI